MPARVVLVLNEPDFAQKAVHALQTAGYEAAALTDPFVALDALEDARQIELLASCAFYGAGKPNGIALARMARFKRPGIKVIFIGAIEHYPLLEGLGAFMLKPVSVDDVVGAIIRMLESDEA